MNGKCIAANETYQDGCSIRRCYWSKDGNIHSSGTDVVTFGEFKRSIIPRAKNYGNYKSHALFIPYIEGFKNSFAEEFVP